MSVPQIVLTRRDGELAASLLSAYLALFRQQAHTPAERRGQRQRAKAVDDGQQHRQGHKHIHPLLPVPAQA